MDKTVVASAGIVIGVLILAGAFQTGLMIGPRYKFQNRRDRSSSCSSSSSGSSGYYSPENSVGGNRRTRRAKRI